VHLCFLSSLFSSFFVFCQREEVIYTTIIGIDVSKDTLIGVRINRSGLQKEEYSLLNTYETIISFLAILQERHKGWLLLVNQPGIFIAVLPLPVFEKEIPFRLINPIPPNSLSKSPYVATRLI